MLIINNIKSTSMFQFMKEKKKLRWKIFYQICSFQFERIVENRDSNEKDCISFDVKRRALLKRGYR